MPTPVLASGTGSLMAVKPRYMDYRFGQVLFSAEIEGRPKIRFLRPHHTVPAASRQRTFLAGGLRSPVLLANSDLADTVGVAHFPSIPVDSRVIGTARVHNVCLPHSSGVAA